MKRTLTVLLFAALTAGAGLFADAAAQAVGYWKSISDVKGEVG
jgi:hypothetical protein